MTPGKKTPVTLSLVNIFFSPVELYLGQELNFVFRLSLPATISGDTALSIFEFAGSQPQYLIDYFCRSSCWSLLETDFYVTDKLRMAWHWEVKMECSVLLALSVSWGFIHWSQKNKIICQVVGVCTWKGFLSWLLLTSAYPVWKTPWTLKFLSQKLDSGIVLRLYTFILSFSNVSSAFQ